MEQTRFINSLGKLMISEVLFKHPFAIPDMRSMYNQMSSGCIFDFVKFKLVTLNFNKIYSTELLYHEVTVTDSTPLPYAVEESYLKLTFDNGTKVNYFLHSYGTDWGLIAL